MDEAERIARKAFIKYVHLVSWGSCGMSVRNAMIHAARFGLESAAKREADMRETLTRYAGHHLQNLAARECLSRCYPPPEPSLLEAAKSVDAGRWGSDYSKSEPMVIIPMRLIDSLRAAIEREERKP